MIRLRLCLMDDEDDEEKRLWYEGRTDGTVGALFVHVFPADVGCDGDRWRSVRQDSTA